MGIDYRSKTLLDLAKKFLGSVILEEVNSYIELNNLHVAESIILLHTDNLYEKKNISKKTAGKIYQVLSLGIAKSLEIRQENRNSNLHFYNMLKNRLN